MHIFFSLLQYEQFVIIFVHSTVYIVNNWRCVTTGCSLSLALSLALTQSLDLDLSVDMKATQILQ